MGHRRVRFVLALALAAALSACALSLRTPRVADLRRHPGHYQHQTVSVSGVVTSAWALPLVPIRMYKISDGTGELTVISDQTRVPARGEHVRVKGRVEEVGVFGGRAVGLHLRQEGLYVKR